MSGNEELTMPQMCQASHYRCVSDREILMQNGERELVE